MISSPTPILISSHLVFYYPISSDIILFFESGIPVEWMKKTDKMSEILYLAITKTSCQVTVYKRL